MEEKAVRRNQRLLPSHIQMTRKMTTATLQERQLKTRADQQPLHPPVMRQDRKGPAATWPPRASQTRPKGMDFLAPVRCKTVTSLPRSRTVSLVRVEVPQTCQKMQRWAPANSLKGLQILCRCSPGPRSSRSRRRTVTQVARGPPWKRCWKQFEELQPMF